MLSDALIIPVFYFISTKALIWPRVSLTCCPYVLGEGAMIFSFDKSTSLEGGSEKNP